MDEPELTGDRRCWPCTVANSIVGLVVGWLPLGAALLGGSDPLVLASIVWGVLVTAYTGFRLLALGYLPGSERVAKRTGLHERIGPGRDGGDDRER